MSILSELVKLARVDSEISEIELTFIQSIAEMLGVEKEYVMALIGEKVAFSPPSSEFDRIEQFHRMVLLANIDLHVDSTEIAAIQKAGIMLGLRPDAVNAVLEAMKNYPNGLIPVKLILDIFKTYHN